MKLVQLIKDFRKWREEKKRTKAYSKCSICAYYGNMKYASFCCSCQNGENESFFIPKLRPITAQEFATIIIANFLGRGWHVTEPLSEDQILAIALDEILKKVKI